MQVAIDLSLHERQTDAFLSPATEILYGGAAGGGKSHLMRAAAVAWCAEIAGLQIYLFRRLHADLVKNHIEGPSGFRNMLAAWVDAKLCSIVNDDEVRFWNGSRIFLCHCKDERSMYKYQGAEIHVLMIDEGTHFLEKMYRFLRNRVRMVGMVVPEKFRGVFPRIIVGANPGNVGHAWVKSTFIDNSQPYELRQMPEKEGGMLRQYIPARVEDNPSLMEGDPGYLARLSGLGSDTLVRAMREGDWSIVDGAYFDCWRDQKHVVRPFAIPPEWPRFRSGDWGTAKPFSFGWWAVMVEPRQMPDGGPLLPRGAIVRYREWYGCKPGEPNVGLRLPATAVGKRLRELQGSEKCPMGVLDPACFGNEAAGPTIHSQIMLGSGNKIIFRSAANSRTSTSRGNPISGWNMLRTRLIGDDDGNPMIACFSTCTDSIRTIPALQHDPHNAEDVDTDGEDHAGDDWRYACNSRPWLPKAKEEKPGYRDGYARAVAERLGRGTNSWKVA